MKIKLKHPENMEIKFPLKKTNCFVHIELFSKNQLKARKGFCK